MRAKPEQCSLVSEIIPVETLRERKHARIVTGQQKTRHYTLELYFIFNRKTLYIFSYIFVLFFFSSFLLLNQYSNGSHKASLNSTSHDHLEIKTTVNPVLIEPQCQDDFG